MAPAARLLALGAVAVLVIAASRGADALRSLGAGTTVAEGDAAVDLNVTNFDAFLGASREPFAVVEFFANWSDSWTRVFSSLSPCPCVSARALRCCPIRFDRVVLSKKPRINEPCCSSIRAKEEEMNISFLMSTSGTKFTDVSRNFTCSSTCRHSLSQKSPTEGFDSRRHLFIFPNEFEKI
jgi:hypothetical protein